MSLFTDVMTVYNHFYDEAAELDRWQFTVIRGVQWSHGGSLYGRTFGSR